MNNSSRSHDNGPPHPLRGSSFRQGSFRNHTDDGPSNGADEAPEVMLTNEEKSEVVKVQRMTQGDTNKVNVWRFAALLVLLATAFCVTYTTYRLLKKEEQNNFETAFEQFSRTVGDAAVHQQQDLRNGLASIATAFATYAATSNESWPFLTLPLFESVAQHARKQAHLETLNFLPRIEAAQRYDWVRYANAKHEGWVEEGHWLQKGSLDRLVRTSEESYHPFVSYRNPDGSFLNETENDLYFVSWQYSPPPATYDLINGNIFSVPQFARVTNAMLQLGSETLVTNVFPHVGIPTAMTREEHTRMHSELLDTRSENPHSFVVHPVHAALLPGQDPDAPRDIMGVLAGASAWDVALLDLLPDGVVGIHTVIRNNCNQSYTYEIRGGDAFYLGPEDLHEPKYDNKEVVVNLALHSHPDFASTPGHCQYEMHIYPSDKFRAGYDSNTPELFALVVATTFVLVAIVFFVYDWFVARRNHNLIVKAAQTNAIVYSLFPTTEDVARAQTRQEDNSSGDSPMPMPVGVVPPEMIKA